MDCAPVAQCGIPLVVALALFSSALPAWAQRDTAAAAPSPGSVMKCTGDGKTWYQDSPCPTGTAGVPMRMEPSAASTTSTPPITAKAPVPTSAQPPAPSTQSSSIQPHSAPQAGATAAAPSREAEACLAWYQREIRSTAEAIYVSSTKSGRVLTMVLTVPFAFLNRNGPFMVGTTEHRAACEVHNGKLDEGWTRIHALRGGWVD